MCIEDKGVVFRIQEELQKLNIEKIKVLISKWVNGMNKNFNKIKQKQLIIILICVECFCL